MLKNTEYNTNTNYQVLKYMHNYVNNMRNNSSQFQSNNSNLLQIIEYHLRENVNKENATWNSMFTKILTVFWLIFGFWKQEIFLDIKS